MDLNQYLNSRKILLSTLPDFYWRVLFIIYLFGSFY